MQKTQLLSILMFAFFTVSSAMIIPQRRQATSHSTRSLTTTATSSHSTSTHSTATMTVTAVTAPTDSTDNGEGDGDGDAGYPPATNDPNTQGADGTSEGFGNVSIGAQVGIIVAVVIVGILVIAGLIIFWRKKKAELAAQARALKRRTLRAKSIILHPRTPWKTEFDPKETGGIKELKEDKPKPKGVLKGPLVFPAGKNGSSSTVESVQVRVVDMEEEDAGGKATKGPGFV